LNLLILIFYLCSVLYFKNVGNIKTNVKRTLKNVSILRKRKNVSCIYDLYQVISIYVSSF